MGNAFNRRSEFDLSPILAGGIPMLSSILGMLGESSDHVSPKLTNLLDNMDPELMETLGHLLSSMIPGKE